MTGLSRSISPRDPSRTSISQPSTSAFSRDTGASTGPATEEGKLRSLRNAVRHGLTAETVIAALEDGEDYKAFEAAVIADYDAHSAAAKLSPSLFSFDRL